MAGGAVTLPARPLYRPATVVTLTERPLYQSTGVMVGISATSIILDDLTDACFVIGETDQPGSAFMSSLLCAEAVTDTVSYYVQ